MSSFLTELPKGWVEATLEDICYKITDGTHKTPKYHSNGIRFISIKNIRPFKPIDFSAYEKYISEKDHAELYKRCDPEFGDIVFPRIGTLGFAKRIDFHEPVSLFVGLGLLKPIKEIVLSKYLELYMNTPWIYRLSHDRATGSGRLTLPLAETRKFPILLAPLPEQHRIVAKIERLFSKLDKAVAQLKKAKEKLELYRQSLLKAAFEGRLTEQWRLSACGDAQAGKEHADELESAEELLAGIKAEREKRYQKQLEEWKKAVNKWEANGKPGKKPRKPRKPKELPPLTEEELAELPKLPKGWGWEYLGTLAEISGGITKNPKRKTLSLQLPFLRVANVYANRLELGNIDMIGVMQSELERTILQRGDILIVEGNGSLDQIGRVAIWNGEIDICVHQNHLIKARLFSQIIPKHILYFLLSDLGRKMITNVASSTSGLHTLSLSKVSKLLIPICSVEEQNKIVTSLETRLSTLDHLTQTIDSALSRAELLRQSILKKTFSGRLVPQVPNDLPAPRSGKWFVYALECNDGSIYIGQTENIEKRWGEHASGKAAEWTKRHPPVKLVHWEEFDSLEEAVKRAKELKTGFGRKWLKREYAAGRTRQAGEPASILLKRIKAEQEKSAKKKKPARKTRGWCA